MSSPSTVSISIERLHELQELERKLPYLIDEAVKAYKKSNLDKLHARDKENPAAVNERVKRYAQKHRDEINKKLREKRKLAKQKKLEESSVSLPTIESAVEAAEEAEEAAEAVEPVRLVRIIRPTKLAEAVDRVISREQIQTPRPPPQPHNMCTAITTNVVVRFDS